MASILQLAGMLPRDPQFREFVRQYMVPPREPTVDEAAQFIRAACDITSRRQLAEDRAAEQRFHQFWRRPFVAWRDQQQSHRRAA
jgi:hypothetical protein